MNDKPNDEKEDERSDRLIQLLANTLGQVTNELILLRQAEEFLDPKPAQIARTDEEKKLLDRRVDELTGKLGGVPRLILTKEGSPPPKYDKYAEAALNELLSFFHRCRRSVVRTHVHFIGLGLIDKYEHLLDLPKDEDLRRALESDIEERFWEHAETSYIRLASLWDRVGQLLDFVYFNIRQYERDGFASVMQRIRANFVVMDDALRNSSDWGRLWEYQKSGHTNGLTWLIRRRNLLVHSLYLRPPSSTQEEEPIFLSEYNHLEESVRKKLMPGSPKEEVDALHVHLEAAASLIRPVIGLCEHGVRLNVRPERDFL